MKSLIYKDLIVQKGTVIFGAFYGSVFFLLFSLLSERSAALEHFVYVLAPVVVTFMLTAGAFKTEKNRSDTFVLSLPVTRSDMVNARFLSLFLFALFGTVTTAALGALFRILPWRLASELISPLDLLRILIGVMLLSCMVPAYLRFGFQAARNFLMVLVFIGVALQVVGLAVLMLFRGGGGVDPIRAATEWFNSYTLLQRNVFMSCLGLMVLAASYLLSLRIYRRKLF
jgi:ABC-2 type transport system permease protein